MNIGQLVVTLGVDTRQLYAAQVQVKATGMAMQTSLATTAIRIRTVGRQMENFYSYGYRATRMLTVPLALLGVAAISTYKKFQTSISRIVGLVGIARDEADKWGKELIAMGPKISRSPQELADALYFVTSAGFKSADALDIVRISGQAAAAGLGQTAEVADIVTSALNAYKGAGVDAAQITDQLIAAVREGKAEPAAFAKSIGQVIPIASELGVGFDQVTGAMAAMTLQGASTANAAVFLKGVLRSLMDPSSEAEATLRAMGTSSQALRDTLEKDGLIAALDEVRQMSEVWGTTLVSDVFPNVRAVLGVLSLMGKNMEYNKMVMKAVVDAEGELEAATAAVSETFEYKWGQALSDAAGSLTTFGKAVAEGMIPMLEGLAKYIHKLTDWFGALSERTQKIIVVFMALVAASGPLYLIFGFLLGNIIPGIINIIAYGLIPAIGALIPMVTSLGAAMALNPILAVVGALAVLATAFAVHRIRAINAAKAQREFTEEVITTDEAFKRIDITDYLRKVGLLKKEMVGDTGLLFFEKLDLSPDALEKMTKLIQEMPVRYLNAMKTELETELIEIQRSIQNFTDSGALVDTVRLIGLKEDVQAVEIALGAINKELTRIPLLTKKKFIDPVLFETLRDLKMEQAKVTANTEIMGGMFDDVEAKSAMWTDALDKLISRLASTDKEIPRLRDEIMKLKNSIEGLEKIKFQRTLTFADRMKTALGDMYDVNEEKKNAYESMLQTMVQRLIIVETTMGKTSNAAIAYRAAIAALATEIRSLNLNSIKEANLKTLGFYKAQAEAFQTISSEINVLNQQLQGAEAYLEGLYYMQQKGTSEWFRTVEAIQTYKDELADLENIKNIEYLEGIVAVWDNISSKVNLLQGEIDGATLALMRLNEQGLRGSVMWDETVASVKKYTEEMLKLERVQAIFNSIASFTTAISQEIGNMLAGAASGYKSLTDIILASAQALIATLLTTAIAAWYAKTAPFPGGLFLASIGIAAMMAQFNKKKQMVADTARMAEGGIIPPGYPNDTFPAMLSSNEAVIPLDRLQPVGNQPLEITIKGGVKGRDIEFLLEKIKTLQNRTR